MNVKELMTNLDKIMDDMGVDPKFKENPAYEDVLSEIKTMIGQMNILDIENVSVYSEGGKISFKYNSVDGDRYSVNISAGNPESISFDREVEKKSFTTNDGQTVRVGEKVQTTAALNNTGDLTLSTVGKSIDNYQCDQGQRNENIMMRKVNYDKNGVMDLSERKYSSSRIPLAYDNAPISLNTQIENVYDKRELVSREKIDTARVVVEDKKNGYSTIAFSAVVPLSTEHGLKNMVPQNGINEYTDSIEIPDMTEFEVQEMVNKETNPKVREGLAGYAQSRAGYHYNSAEDPNFVHKVDEVLQAKAM